MTLTIEQRVANGIALLDKHRPGWEEEISLPDLYMSSCSWCVLGQVFKDYNVGLIALFGDGKVDYQGQVDSGFELEDEIDTESLKYWHELEQEWRKQIEARTVQKL